VKDICDAAKENGAWVHVDGAFGLWAAAPAQFRDLVEGVSAADSWATDAHKSLTVPRDSGVVSCAMLTDFTRPCLFPPLTSIPDKCGSQWQWVPETSRRPRGVEIWAALQSLGRDGVAELIDRTCAHAQAFAAGRRSAGYEILNEVVLNPVVVAFGDDEKTDRAIRAILTVGTCWCGGTQWKGRKAMRISVSSWAATNDDLAISLAAMLRIASNASDSWHLTV
jgi:glutamate/tyrosine decarboxylase-like PLP-dependent enzyme